MIAIPACLPLTDYSEFSFNLNLLGMWSYSTRSPRWVRGIRSARTEVHLAAVRMAVV
jgi:hypothetical protein